MAGPAFFQPGETLTASALNAAFISLLDMIGNAGTIVLQGEVTGASSDGTVTTSLAPNGGTAGTYTQVTVDDTGRVVEGELFGIPAFDPINFQETSGTIYLQNAVTIDVVNVGTVEISGILVESIANSVTAAGTSLATATPLIKDINIITAGTGGVSLRSPVVGVQEVINTTSITQNIFGTIGAATTVQVVGFSAVRFVAQSGSQWAIGA